MVVFDVLYFLMENLFYLLRAIYQSKVTCNKIFLFIQHTVYAMQMCNIHIFILWSMTANIMFSDVYLYLLYVTHNFFSFESDKSKHSKPCLSCITYEMCFNTMVA